MKDKKPLLSICIPTYNGASGLFEKTLQNSLSILDEYHDDIELIVSDNASTDDTFPLLEQNKDHLGFRYYRNQTNIGFKGNIKRITEEYASGLYTWIIGDDDIIIPSAVPFLLSVLRTEQYAYLSLGSVSVPSLEDSYLKLRASDYKAESCSYSRAIDQNCYSGNVLATFIGASVFLTEAFRSYPKDFFSNSFSSYKDVFPNAYILATLFCQSSCACITQKCVLALKKEKAWSTSDNIYRIYTEVLPSLYNYVVSLGASKRDLDQTRDIILYTSISLGMDRLREGRKAKKLFSSIVQVMFRPNLIKRFLGGRARRLIR